MDTSQHQRPSTPDRVPVGSSALLGSSGFIFLDERPWPYLVRKESSGDWWLYYWRDSTKQFATMRQIESTEMLAFRERRLPPEKAAMYLPNQALSDQYGQ